MPDMESLEFPVGEGYPRGRLDSAWVKMIAAVALGDEESIHRYRAEVEAAVSAKARAEERERAEDALMEMLQTLSPFSGGQSRPARVEDGRRALAQAEAIMWRMVPDYGRQQEIARRLWSARSSEEAGG